MQGSIANELNSLEPSSVPPEPQTHSQPPIGNLPVELLTKVLHDALPSIDTQALEHPDTCLHYMQALYKLQLVTKRWKEVVDATPVFWALVSWGFADRQNITNMDKSLNSPLLVHCSGRTRDRTDGGVSCLHFLELIEPARHRWQVLWLDSVLPEGLPRQLAEPAPILENITLNCFPGDIDDPEVFTLFGHHVSTVRFVSLMQLAFHPSPSPFHDLSCFTLYSTRGNTISVEWIEEVLRGSPQIERLRLIDLYVQTPTVMKPIATITLVHLKSLTMDQMDGSAIDYIVRRIEAPNCIQFQLAYDGERTEDYDPSLLLDSALASFEPILQDLVQRMPNPYLSIDADSIWGQHPSPNFESDLTPFFHLDVEEVPFLAVVRWVDRVVDPTRWDRGPAQWPFMGSLHITGTTPLADPEIAARLKHLKSVTHISAEVSTADIRQLLEILGETGPEPWFPYLRQLNVHAYRWEARELLETIRARLARPSPLVPQLTVIVRRQILPNFPEAGNRVIFDPDIMHEFRALKGVSVVYPGGEDAD
ncbi:hypothetical protein FS837_011705 [Tulasnella sp. UAMH 9824]|nr:hypothetical protein FS837_011705 [Tulasnella sp. UAMH 9824]